MTTGVVLSDSDIAGVLRCGRHDGFILLPRGVIKDHTSNWSLHGNDRDDITALSADEAAVHPNSPDVEDRRADRLGSCRNRVAARRLWRRCCRRHGSGSETCCRS